MAKNIGNNLWPDLKQNAILPDPSSIICFKIHCH